MSRLTCTNGNSHVMSGMYGSYLKYGRWIVMIIFCIRILINRICISLLSIYQISTKRGNPEFKIQLHPFNWANWSKADTYAKTFQYKKRNSSKTRNNLILFHMPRHTVSCNLCHRRNIGSLFRYEIAPGRALRRQLSLY